MQRIGSGFLWNQLNTLYVREGACEVRVQGAEDSPLDETSHQSLGEGSDAMLRHKTFRSPFRQPARTQLSG
jgi:hypothetical protein